MSECTINVTQFMPTVQFVSIPGSMYALKYIFPHIYLALEYIKIKIPTIVSKHF